MDIIPNELIAHILFMNGGCVSKRRVCKLWKDICDDIISHAKDVLTKAFNRIRTRIPALYDKKHRILLYNTIISLFNGKVLKRSGSYTSHTPLCKNIPCSMSFDLVDKCIRWKVPFKRHERHTIDIRRNGLVNITRFIQGSLFVTIQNAQGDVLRLVSKYIKYINGENILTHTRTYVEDGFKVIDIYYDGEIIQSYLYRNIYDNNVDAIMA